MYTKDLSVSYLIDVYGSLLSDRRREIIEAYYFDDLSLAEIADNTGITRQGVRDSIKKSENELKSIEDSIHLASLIKKYDSRTKELADRIDEIRSALPSSASSQLEMISSELRSISE